MSIGELENKTLLYHLHNEIAGNRSVRATVWVKAG